MMMNETTTEDLSDIIQFTSLIKNTKQNSSECKICGAPALYSYVSVIVCVSCKMFFKRNAEPKKKYSQCRFDGLCEVNILNRHICPSCRLAKCFASGMQTCMLRCSRSKPNTKKQKTKFSSNILVKNEQDQPQQLSTLNLLRSDQSTLNNDQWNLLSNLTHCYDEHSQFSIAEQFMRDQNSLPLKMRFKLSPVDKLLALFMSGPKLLFEKNVDFISLCPHDRSLLLHNTMKHVGGFGCCFMLHRVRLLDNSAFHKTSEIMYGSTTIFNTKRTANQLDLDIVFVKLTLTILVFSTIDYTCYTNTDPINLKDIKAVLRIQDMYVELAWRYLLYKYDHDRAVMCFSNLIRCLFILNDAIVAVAEVQQYMDMIDLLVRKTEETLSIIE